MTSSGTPDRTRLVRPVDQSVVPLIVGMCDPVVRNLWITTAYHDLAVSLTHGLGATNVNWCGFAAWASKTAGISIRGDFLRGFVRSAVSGSEVFRKAVAVLAAWVPDPVEEAIEERLLAPVDGAVDHVRDRIARGNLLVFEELGPLFARLAVVLPDPSAHEAFLASVVAIDDEPDSTAQLRLAFRRYLEAATTTDPRARAEHVLLANGLIGLTEQVRLQPMIRSALEAPFGDGFLTTVDALLERCSVPIFLRASLVRRAADVQEVWRRAVTDFFLSLQAPDGDHSLGGDAPPHDGATQFPADLHEIADPVLREFLARYDRTAGTGKGSGASDWADLDDRMNYIVNLLRSWQQRSQLLRAPFTGLQLRELAAGRRPPEPL